jgi:uncharacterized protein YhaN
VRFTRLQTVAFGPLEERVYSVDSDIILVYGPNEAGKSSFRMAMETILYGFKPADRDLHPLAQWDPSNPQTLHLESELRLDTGELLCVERVLQSSGRLRIADEGAVFSGPRSGNRALPWMEWLSREVFGQLYSLELEQLAKLDERARADIDDLLLPRTSALPLRVPSEIRGELHKACNDLWRTDNRGSSAAKKLRERLKAARNHLGEEQRRDRELRDARSERAEVESELQALRTNKRDLERERADASFLGDLFGWNRHRRALGPAIDLSELEGHRLLRPSELDVEIETHETRLREPQARLAQAEVPIAEATAQVLALSTEIELALEALARWNADRERLAEQRQDASKDRDRARDELRAALGGEPGGSELAAAAAVPIEALASAATEWSDARDREFDGASPMRTPTLIWQLIAGCAGLATIGAGWFKQFDPKLIGLGTLLLIVTVCVGWFTRPRDRREPPTAPRELGALLGELPVPQTLSSSPAALQRLVGLLVGVQRSLANASERESGSAELEAQLVEREHGWKTLCERAGVDANGGGDLKITRLRAALESARAERGEVERDARQREDAQTLIEFEKPALDAKLEHREKLRAALHAAEPEISDFELAFERVEERSAEVDFLRRRESELRRDPRFAEFENDPRVIAEDPPEDAPWLPGVRSAREQRLYEFDERLSEKQNRLGQLTALLGQNTAGALSDAADAVREIRDEMKSTERERDRLALLESILGRAEREYRELHQPDVLRRASEYLERITDGRYRRIDLLDGNDGLLGVTLDGRSEPIEVRHPISQGTLDQIFLCLRLGMLDHLDEGRERLPLILDDALLRMDDQRRSAVYSLLGNISPTRQVWILTCNRALADEIESGLKVSRIDL